MSAKISLEIVTPERSVLKDLVDSVAVPAYEGEIGVLPRHAPLLTQMKPGALRFVKDGETYLFAVSGGFAEVHPGRVDIFAETAEMAEEIDSERARLAAEEAKQTLASKTLPPDEMAKIQAALQRALVRLRLADKVGQYKTRK
jgi:F-type H+-transporting ATPase subunit epsilon